MRFPIFSCFIGLSYAASIVPRASQNETTPDYNNLTVAIVRAEPVNWPLPILNKNWTGVKFNLNGTVQKGVKLIGEAAQNGANLVVFPETWFPGYPKGMGDNTTIADYLADYIDNSMEVPSPQWDMIVGAAKKNQVYVLAGFTHKDNGYLYMAQSLISPEGEILLLRHKLRPSPGERGLWSDGTIDQLKVIATPYGRWGILECWEHFHPSMTFITQSQAETLHLGSWPYTPNENDAEALGWETAEANVGSARTYANQAGAPFVFATVGNARFLDSSGLDLSVVNASVSMVDVPLMYHSFNTTGLAATVPYTTDGEQSWGILEQIRNGFPSYIPRVIGSYTPHEEFPITGLLASANATKST